MAAALRGRRTAGTDDNGQRAMLIGSFVNNLGNGLLMTAQVLFFTRAVGLPVGQVGLGLTVAGLIGLAGGVPIGHLADRVGARRAYLWLLVITAATMLAHLAVTTVWTLIVVVGLDLLAGSGANAARGALIRQVGGEGAVVFRSRLRVYSNLGVSLGAAAAGVTIAVDTPFCYRLLIVANAATFLLCGWITRRVPDRRRCVAPGPEAGGHGGPTTATAALRDRTFLAFTGLNGLMTVQFAILTVALPLWISRTAAPLWTVAGIMVLNTVLCVALQVAVGARVHTVTSAGYAFALAGGAFLVSCALSAALPGLGPAVAIAVLTLAVVVHTGGELLHTSGQFVLGFDLAPEHAQGQYSGLQNTVAGLGTALAPSLLVFLCLEHGRAGWFGLGLLLAATGLLTLPLVRHAGRRTAAELGSGLPQGPDATPT